MLGYFLFQVLWLQRKVRYGQWKRLHSLLKCKTFEVCTLPLAPTFMAKNILFQNGSWFADMPAQWNAVHPKSAVHHLSIGTYGKLEISYAYTVNKQISLGLFSVSYVKYTLIVVILRKLCRNVPFTFYRKKA